MGWGQSLGWSCALSGGGDILYQREEVEHVKRKNTENRDGIYMHDNTNRTGCVGGNEEDGDHRR